MEFVVIEYVTQRRARMDRSLFGLTQVVLQCRAGLHDFDLATPKDYSPLSQTVNVRGTSPLSPMRITFHPLTAAFIRLPPPAEDAAPVAARSSRRRKRGPKKTAARQRKASKRHRPKTSR